jgi:hypothetical protein
VTSEHFWDPGVVPRSISDIVSIVNYLKPFVENYACSGMGILNWVAAEMPMHLTRMQYCQQIKYGLKTPRKWLYL